MNANEKTATFIGWKPGHRPPNMSLSINFNRLAYGIRNSNSYWMRLDVINGVFKLEAGFPSYQYDAIGKDLGELVVKVFSVLYDAEVNRREHSTK